MLDRVTMAFVIMVKACSIRVVARREDEKAYRATSYLRRRNEKRFNN